MADNRFISQFNSFLWHVAEGTGKTYGKHSLTALDRTMRDKMQKTGTFAHKELAKQGWVCGKGLGKNENGIKAPIKVAFKNDTVGLGVDRAEEFTFHWWDHVFNKTAKSIQVETSSEGEIIVERKKVKSSDVLDYSKKGKRQADKKSLLYGHFLKASTLSGGKEILDTKDKEEESTDEESSDYQIPGKGSVIDEVYHKTGLTGHKAARHGHRLSGKLKRVLNHEQIEIKSGISSKKFKCSGHSEITNSVENESIPLETSLLSSDIQVTVNRKGPKDKDVPSTVEKEILKIKKAKKRTKKKKKKKERAQESS